MFTGMNRTKIIQKYSVKGSVTNLVTVITAFILTSCKEECFNLHHRNNDGGRGVVYLTFITLLLVIILCFVIIYMYKTYKRVTEENALLKEKLNKIKEEQPTKQEEKKADETNMEGNVDYAEEKHEPLPKPSHEYDTETMDMIEKAMEEQHLYLIQDLNLKKLADKMNITQKKILEVFKHHPDYANLNTYLNHKRIEHACTKLIEHTNYTVESIASDSGFSSPITFYRWFERETGMKPKEYREKVLKDKESNT